MSSLILNHYCTLYFILRHKLCKCECNASIENILSNISVVFEYDFCVQVERAEKKKTLDQAIRERNREMFGTHRRATRAETKVETTAKT